MTILIICLSPHLEESPFYDALNLIGINVPLTPFTVDMSLMVDSKGMSYYQREFELIYESINKKEKIDVKNLGWYEFKSPFQNLYECKQGRLRCDHLISYICRYLSSYTNEKVISWSIEDKSKKTLHDKSFNEVFSCLL